MNSLEKFSFKTHIEKSPADIITPVAVYLRLRQKFPESLLLESTDSRGAENSWSFICCEKLAEIKLCGGTLHKTFPNGERSSTAFPPGSQVLDELSDFFKRFEFEKGPASPALRNLPPGRAMFGYTAYASIPYIEDISFKSRSSADSLMADMNYAFFRYTIAVNHFHDQMYIMENVPVGFDCPCGKTGIGELKNIINDPSIPSGSFAATAPERSNATDDEFIDIVAACKDHIFKGDVFQIVPSRRFEQSFEGDDFNVYRALRSINPSPYLFYFDYGDYRIFGSSPEAQLKTDNGLAVVNPIAGTYKRGEGGQSDSALERSLKSDPKENAEHIMLVDLARNDLSRHCSRVEVKSLQEIHFYSHLIHMVSEVTGRINSGVTPMQILGDTFPAGTLSGAPKYRAMELIDRYERSSRGCYGGAIGLFGFDGSSNHAILIRSFFSSGKTLYYQAGAGVVADSVPENELQEVNTKLEALKKAVKLGAEL